MSTQPSATPAPAKRSGPGCLVLAVLLPVVVLAGIVIGTVLNRPDDPPEEQTSTLDEGAIAGTAWRVDAVRDVEGELCVFLYEDDVQLTGACDDTPQDATFGDQTVVFGRSSQEEVSVVLNNAETVDIETTAVDGLDGRFYVEVVDGDVDVERLAGP